MVEIYYQHLNLMNEDLRHKYPASLNRKFVIFYYDQTHIEKKKRKEINGYDQKVFLKSSIHIRFCSLRFPEARYFSQMLESSKVEEDLKADFQTLNKLTC